MKVALITRIKSLDSQKEISYFKGWLKFFLSDKRIVKIYVITLRKREVDRLNIKDDKIKTIESNEPTSPTSMNLAIKEFSKDIDYFLISSKEINFEQRNINQLISEIEKYKKEKLLVVGYKFKIVNKEGKIDKKLNDELQEYYRDKELIAYRVPWNTCAIWNYKKFKDYVGKFDEITARNPFPDICVCIDNVCNQTAHEGMEDGLAIAQASSQKKKPKIHFKLLDDYLFWKIDNVKRHREKLARKDTVLRNFTGVRNYPVEDLKVAKVEELTLIKKVI